MCTSSGCCFCCQMPDCVGLLRSTGMAKPTVGLWAVLRDQIAGCMVSSSLSLRRDANRDGFFSSSVSVLRRQRLLSSAKWSLSSFLCIHVSWTMRTAMPTRQGPVLPEHLLPCPPVLRGLEICFFIWCQAPSLVRVWPPSLDQLWSRQLSRAPDVQEIQVIFWLKCGWKTMLVGWWGPMATHSIIPH